MTQRAMIVIDMVRDFVDSDGKLTCGERAQRIVGAIASRVAAARERGDCVIFVGDRHREGDGEFDMFVPHCVEGTPGAEFIPDLVPGPDDIVIHKRRFSAFFQTDLDLTLRERGVREIELAGVCTNICILYTAADARMRGYGVTVARDAVASFDEEAHEFALKQMERTLGVQII